MGCQRLTGSKGHQQECEHISAGMVIVCTPGTSKDVGLVEEISILGVLRRIKRVVKFS